MDAGAPWYYYAILAVLGMGGIGGLSQIWISIQARGKRKPEVDSIIADGARNAVESLQVALIQSNSELKEVRARLAEMETHYEAEIAALMATIETMKGSLASAEARAKALAAELAARRAERE